MCFGLALLAAGIAALGAVIWSLAIPILKVYRWESVPCRVLHAETEYRGLDLYGKVSVDVKAELEWEYAGTRYTGGKLSTGVGFDAGESVNSKEEYLHHLRQAGSQRCYVNPANPAEAILRMPDWYPTIVFAALATMIAGIGILLLRAARQSVAGGGPGPRTGALLALLFGAAFCGGAVAVFWYGILGAFDWKASGARMKEVPCIMEGAGVARDSGSNRSSAATWRPRFVFRYNWDGRSWLSEWYDFSKKGPGSSEREEAVALTKKFQRGSSSTCWVDPEHPWVAVLHKSAPPPQWLWFPVALCLLPGGFFVVASLRMLWRLRRQSAGPSPA